MADLIERSSALEELCRYCAVECPEGGCAEYRNISKLSAVDAEKVIRCKNCKHWSDGVRGCTDHVKCCKIGFYMVGENGYCVYGERKEDG